MFRHWLRTHASLVITTTSVAVIAALIAAVAIVSTGYTAQRLDLGDGAVWVSNSQQQAIGRANTQVLELNSVVESTGSDIEVLQRGETVLLLDRTENLLDIVDPATSEVTDSVPLPPNQPYAFLAGNRVIIVEEGTGEVWIVAATDLATFDSESDSTLSLGADAVVSVDPEGLMFAYSPSSGLVYRVNAAASDTVESTSVLSVETSAAAAGLSITSVDGRWAVLDANAQLLYVDGRTIELGGLIGTGTGAVLQWASTTGSSVLVSYSGGLLTVPFSGSGASVVAGQSGTPARPLITGDCEFAAWTGGATWRRCDSGEPEQASDGALDRAGATIALASMPSTARLSFMTNGAQAVLNDRRSGATWAVQRAGELIDNWDALIVADDEAPQEQQNDEDVPPQVDAVQAPPTAVDDAFGARAGRATVLPVLLNDYDPNGDVLVVGDLVPLDAAVGRIDLITERQQIQLTLPPGASGQLRFDYTVTDGRGGSDTATVVVTIRASSENSAPQQVRSTKAVVETGGRVTTQVLSDWVDPDGDAFYLTSAGASAPDAVTYKPAGDVIFSDSGTGSDLKIVTVVVSDGNAQASGSLSVTVKAVGEVPIVADPFVMLAYAGTEITLSPLDHVRGGNGTIRLNSVPSKTDVTITPSYETGTFRFTSDQVRSYYIDYVVTDGSQTVTGLVRIDVATPPTANSQPITVPKTVFVQTLRNERVDVAGTDVDPAGGVLLVTGVTNLPFGSGVRAEVLEQRIVRVSLEAPLDNGPVTFNYRVSNGLAEAEGVITVIEIPPPARVQPPIAAEDSVTVRVGEAIDIPVLRNDEHPDGLPIALDPKLDQSLPANSGLLFTSGRILRYLAPNQPGNFTAVYRVSGPDGQSATALVSIAVREPDVATNNAPVPETMTARVLAGQSVRVTIPLTGIDPDGDSVQLLGQSTNPEKGAVIATENDTIVYQAGDYSAGTDTFSYTVIDGLGSRATGTVRVGISPRLDGARNPVAIVDEVTVRPGVTVSVQVLDNDSDPDGSPLTVVSAVPNDLVTKAKIVGDVVDVTPPSTPGSYGVIYSIENDSGGTSQNFIRVIVKENAPLSYPIASDSVLTLSDVQGRDKVTVDVIANVFFADGPERGLGLSVYPGYGDVARVTSSKRIEVTIGDKNQIIPFKVTHPDDDTVFSYAFIRVPGTGDALPQLDTRAPVLRVASEEELVIDLNKYVIAIGGKQVQLTDSSTVRATHADGSNLVRDQDTLVYTSAEKYFGPASISFEVTDGTSAGDPNGRTATLVLPIVVVPRDNQPPAFGGAVIEFEPGQEKELDLLKLTTYPYPADLDQLIYSVIPPAPSGFTYALNGNLLTLRADDDALTGTVSSVTLAVRDDISEGRSGRIQMTIVQSTQPVVRPAADTSVVRRGGTTTVDVLANDEATNPFPGKPLRVVGIRGIDGASLPAGVQVVPSADNSSLAVIVAGSAAPSDISLQYQVADATDDPSRYVWGAIAVSIQDRPEPISNLTATAFGDRQLTMIFNAGGFNNSPITGYRLTTTTAAGAVTSTTVCAGTACVVPTPGNGAANGVRVSVVATNAIGDSDPVSTGGVIWSDVVPAAPLGLSAAPLDRGLSVSWSEVPTPVGGSPVSNYVVTVGGVTSTVACSSPNCSTDIIDSSLTNGSLVTVTVSARNESYAPLTAWNSSSAQGTPAGPPIAVGTPLATAVSDTAISLDWGSIFSDNGRAIVSYTAAAYTGAVPTCTADGSVTPNGAALRAVSGTSTQFNSLSPDGEYSLIVFAFNGQGCTESPAVIAHTRPGVITAISVSAPTANGEVYDLIFTGGEMDGVTITSDYVIYYRLNGGTEYGPITIGEFMNIEPAQYGQNLAVNARACRTYDSQPLCQTVESGDIALAEVAVDPRLIGITFVADPPPEPDPDPTVEPVLTTSGTFSWTGYPTGVYDAVDVVCGPAPGIVQPASDTTCHSDALVGEDSTLTVVVTANGTTYPITYYWYDYD